MEVAIGRKRTFLRCNFLNFGYGCCAWCKFKATKGYSIVMFDKSNKSLFKFHFYNYLRKRMKLRKNSQAG